MQVFGFGIVLGSRLDFCLADLGAVGVRGGIFFVGLFRCLLFRPVVASLAKLDSLSVFLFIPKGEGGVN